MRRIISISLLLLSAVALLVASPAAFAAKKKSQANLPEITRVQPMRVSVGGTLTITGKRFKGKRSANTVIFRAGNGRSAFAKPRRASTTKLRVVVPAAVAGLLTVKDSKQRPTRLKLRVLAGKFSKFTSRRLSPVVTGAGDGDDPDPPRSARTTATTTTTCCRTARELQIGTDPCLEDTDGDNMSDGWEYCSAKDLNVNSVPYPGERPYLNPLDPSDGAPGSPAGKFSAYDFDGDGLTSREEYRLWRISGSSTLAALLDGCSATAASPRRIGLQRRHQDQPRERDPRRAGLALGELRPRQPDPALPGHLQPEAAIAEWRDSERDADGDGLSNRLESARGPSTNAWWQGYWAATPAIEPYPDTYFGFYNQRPFADLDLADPDVDGDTLLDGEDDQDNDDVTNITEMYETEYDLDGNGNPTINGRPGIPSVDRDPTVGVDNKVVNAMNPCAPDPLSRTCEDYAPF